jgi:hypothetical protein
MAIFITGKSICQICNKVLGKQDEIIAFPPFVANVKDAIRFCNDEAFHYKCLMEHPLGERAVELSDQFIFKKSPENRFCDIGRNPIPGPDSYILMPLLTSDESEELYAFNFMSIDKHNIKNWNDRERFIAIVKRFRSEGKWGDRPGYDFLGPLLKDFE